jgi:hypothetical protein
VLSFRIELNPGQSKRLWVGWNLWGAEVDSKPSVITNSTYLPVKVLEQLRIGNE